MKKLTGDEQKLSLAERSRRRAWRGSSIVALLVAASCGLGFAVAGHSGHGRRPSGEPSSLTTKMSASKISTSKASAPNNPTTAAQKAQPSGRFDYRLAMQPEANKMRRRLGQRFQTTGLETTISDAVLTIGSQRQPIRIIRVRDDDAGEQVALALGGGLRSLSWNVREGAESAGRAPDSDDRRLIERIVLDSPDQFILAQTRGASYYTIGQNVMPAEAGDSESYSGTLWDLVRIVEPRHGLTNKPESEWRIYYINVMTGFVDKVVYEEQGEMITVEMTGWTNRDGEVAPSRIRWTAKGQVLMELNVNNVSYGPR